jgi:hypothetical protein
MIFGSLAVVGFVIALCFGAGFLFASRVGKSTNAKVLLGFLFGLAFLLALTGLAVAGCVVLVTTSK